MNANAAPKPSTLVAPHDAVHLAAPAEQFVSRAGQKLEAALNAFAIDVAGKRVIDVGASTGGFTDCLLQHNAEHVVALDVGYGQLHWRIRNDARVDVIERTNIRHVDPAAIGAPFDVIVADLSFISLETVADSLDALGSGESNWILLIKPQFEAGRDRVGKGGIVRDPEVRYDVVRTVLASLDAIGLGCRGVIESPIKGTTGNTEYVAWFQRGAGTVETTSIESLIKGVDQ
ncbi:MAG: 16S/23S rRNA (cytidine-2'-O)-methyltransferase TlyA [Acidimicrobiia bacterium]|nr:MAG: 16S/23S rRNA (cytidine-2'-O)-methyltransferase TlyA [Acidimicrobiia bacterium]